MSTKLHLCWTKNLIGSGDGRGYVMHAAIAGHGGTLCGYAWEQRSPRNMDSDATPDCLKCRAILRKMREKEAGELPLEI